MSQDKVRPSPTTLRGIAHPLRLKMLNLLRADGPSTASMLAERTGQSTGATSYHLRQLAQYGFVVEDPALGAGRERWWKAAHRGTLLEGDIVREAPADTEAYLRAVASLYAERVDRWLGERVTLPAGWDGASTLSDTRLRLTADEARDLHRELDELIGRYRRDDPDAVTPAGAERVVVQWQLMPFLTGAVAGAEP
ncbi:helix-turn-helix domain-containing protein, partial [Micromonospora zhanjiangensis]